MSLYEIGDLVRIREDLCDGERYGGVYCNWIMARFGGETAMITKVYFRDDQERRKYEIDVDHGDWAWSGEMFSGFAEENDADFEISLDDLF